MLQKIICYLPCLGLAAGTNILLGTYQSVGKLREAFSWRLLLTGILKAAIVSEGLVALALILDKLNGACDLGAFAVMPDALLLGVIAVYFGKCAGHLKDIFAVTDRQLSDAGLPAYQPQAEPAAHELPEEGGEG